MNDFVSGFWGYYITTISVLGILFCLWLLWIQRKYLGKATLKVEDTGHVWDGNLRELNHPVPRWWTIMFIGSCAFGVIYLVLYPGLGSWPGVLDTNSRVELKQDQAAQDAAVAPIYAKYAKMSIPEIAADPAARVIGQRLFLNNCAQCHGSDAKGSPSFPNLTEGDSIYGRTPEAIVATITNGRNGIMPPLKGAIDAKTAGDIAQYVRSLSGLAHDQIRVVNGKKEFMNTCAACHGPDGKGNKALGAPNLTDDVWLYGSSEDTIVYGILNGRNNRMPAWAGILTPEQIRMVGAFEYSLSGGKDVTSSVLNAAAAK